MARVPGVLDFGFQFGACHTEGMDSFFVKSQAFLPRLCTLVKECLSSSSLMACPGICCIQKVYRSKAAMWEFSHWKLFRILVKKLHSGPHQTSIHHLLEEILPQLLVAFLHQSLWSYPEKAKLEEQKKTILKKQIQAGSGRKIGNKSTQCFGRF